MKIEYLQKLDFLLKKVNNHSQSKSYKILFGLNNKIYTGDFIPKVTYENYIEYKDVDAYNSDEYILISLANINDWKEIANTKPGSNRSSFGKLLDRSAYFSSSDYLQLLDITLKAYPIEFKEPLLPYIFNLKMLNGEIASDFIKVNENTEFDFVSIVPENEL
ncbi:hypothetical protein [Staphylococcus simiae]|uniref:Uncharacterized protein n=1 Tax=Staphylococcus simiae CCM 7213 = CCUG 51256 TaxID=911238 RepID=G5JFV9_9STAP|nr:hypothetical protein [Staphylococcus simiae]EHJ08907.1 hypothetical protein SS7213T_01616 [Staphylococcus simiae CCM 7213 = CCUG 51256]PNZ13982.1 hypothetical protein CD113_03310 [Staphylococcus simiae]SNV64972.1 Uncharacterised protein [Staphylococcus simiae]